MSEKNLNFVVIGPPRTGTTWIDQYLRGCNSVFLPKGIKETYFFTRRYNKGLEWYFSHFRPLSGSKIIGEVDPTYFYTTLATQRIHEVNPNCKIIVTLRNPVERAFPHYILDKRCGSIKLKTRFKEALIKYPILIESSRYHTYLSRWLKYFGRGNVCIVLFDDLRNDPMVFTKKLCDFLQIEQRPIPPGPEKNKLVFPSSPGLAKISSIVAAFLDDRGLYFPRNILKRSGLGKIIYYGGRNVEEKLAEGDKLYLYSLLEEKINNLEKLLQMDFSNWRVK